MRIGLISDIHSNLEALQVVLGTMKRLKIDRYICLGDLVGYGANPNEVMDLVRPIVDFTTLGNHDAAVAGRMEYHYYYESAREALTWTRQLLSPENINYLKELPYIRTLGEVCYVHGEPINPELFNYVYLIAQATELVEQYDKLSYVTFVGHSHLRRVFELSPTGAVELPVENISLRPDHKYVIAIGSVGQPRDYDPRACFLIYDEDQKRVEFYRVDYDVDAAAEAIMRSGLPEYFATRLFSGS